LDGLFEEPGCELDGKVEHSSSCSLKDLIPEVLAIEAAEEGVVDGLRVLTRKVLVWKLTNLEHLQAVAVAVLMLQGVC
jgi:hypothetical protein